MAAPSAVKLARTSAGVFIGDSVTGVTAAGGTPFHTPVPPRAGARAKITIVKYINGATAHVLTMMPALARTFVMADALGAGTVVSVQALPTYPDGTLPAAGDFIVVQHDNGDWRSHEIGSISGFSITVTAAFPAVAAGGGISAPRTGSFVQPLHLPPIPLTGQLFFMGAAADHPDKQFAMTAANSPPNDLYNSTGGWCKSLLNGDPILMHSNNATNAGVLTFSYEYEVVA